MNGHAKTVKRQKGVAALELAIAVPVLLLLLLASAELGRAFYQYNTLTKSVRDGARYLSENSLGAVGFLSVSLPLGECLTRALSAGFAVHFPARGSWV